MALVPNSWVWPSKPSTGTLLDEGWYLYPYLSGIVPFNEGAGPPSIQGQFGSIAATGTPSWSTQQKLWSCVSTASNSLTFGKQYGSNLGLTWSLVIWFNAVSLANSPVLIGKGPYQVSGGSWYIQLTGSFTLDVNENQPTWDPPLVTGTVYCACLSVLAGVPSLYLNGINQGAPTSYSSVPSITDTADALKFGDYSAGGFAFNGYIGQTEFYAGIALGQAQVSERYYFPFSPFASPLPFWLGNAAAAPTSSLFCPATLSLGSGGPFFQSAVNS